jgi:hypothetical protein
MLIQEHFFFLHSWVKSVHQVCLKVEWWLWKARNYFLIIKMVVTGNDKWVPNLWAGRERLQTGNAN